jgi:hypothetical protein
MCPLATLAESLYLVRMSHRLLSCFVVVTALACGGTQPPPPAAPEAAAPTASTAPSESASGEAPAPAPAESAAPAQAGAIDWKSMDKKARGKYMKDVVMPKMKEVFTAFDAKKYANMQCMTCHGSGATNGSFAMPNPELPQLPADMSKFKEWAAKKPQMTEFMVKHVKPEMAKLLNEPEYNPETKVGFGCAECHTMATK